MTIPEFLIFVAATIAIGIVIAVVGLNCLELMIVLCEKKSKRNPCFIWHRFFLALAFWKHSWISKDNMFWVVDLTIYGLVIQMWRTPYGKEKGLRRINLWWNIRKLS